MRIGTSPFEYDWISDWAEIPNQASAVSGWAHHGMAVTDSGEVIAIHPAESLAMMFDQDDVYAIDQRVADPSVSPFQFLLDCLLRSSAPPPIEVTFAALQM